LQEIHLSHAAAKKEFRTVNLNLNRLELKGGNDFGGVDTMNNKILVMLTAGLMAAPIAAIAQITTLSYDGDLMAGTSTYLFLPA